MALRRILALLFLAIIASTARPVFAHRNLSDGNLFVAETDSFMNALLAQLPEIPSVAIAVVLDDQVVLTRGYGTADRERHIPASDETIYYIASATKPFTALAAALLDERGTLDLDSSLASHLTDSPMNPQLIAQGVTLRDLLSHTSGLENDPITTRLAYTGEHTPQQLWDLLSSTKANEAGAGNFQYTNFDYNLLTMILDHERGIQWQDLLREEIFEPAGMKRTTAYASL
ncbi:MAG TPA: serine hydrolase domain-containing protein, partial [Candidatus Krumholzibacteria bacterium]|nr:serine hydrolase domain-containing protein [Candidatus Krumholzibacteria bacterium]